MHTQKPLSESEILNVMPTDESISRIYASIRTENPIDGSLPTWGDAIVWEELHMKDMIYHRWD